MSEKAYKPREYQSFAYAKRVGKRECMRRGIKAYSVYRLWSNILVVGVDEHAKFLAYVKEHEIPIGRNDEYRVYVWQAGKTDWSRLTQVAPDLGKATDYKPDPIEVYYPDTEQTKECGWCHQMNNESNLFCWHCEGEI